MGFFSTTIIASVLASNLSVPVTQVNEKCELIHDVNFDHYKQAYQSYTKDLAESDFGLFNSEKGKTGSVKGLDTADKEWEARNVVGEGVLRASYPANKASGNSTGILFDQRFENTEEAVIEYDLKFSEDFFWAAGGKLPGLGGSIESEVPPWGCTKDETRVLNGFSARLMWRRNGGLVAYTYFPNRMQPRKGNCGIDYPITTVEADRWYTVRQYIKLNTPGENNGVLRVSVDGEVKLDMQDVLYRKTKENNFSINNLVFHTYRGGGAKDKRFHSPQQDYVFFDNVKLWRNCADLKVGSVKRG